MGEGQACGAADRDITKCANSGPGIVVNDRLDIPGDFVTPEQYQPAAPLRVDGVEVPWEACQTLNGSWGHDCDNLDDKSPDLLIRMQWPADRAAPADGRSSAPAT